MDFYHKREEFSVIHWKPICDPPEECSYILIQCLDENGNVVCEPASYEQGEFFYSYGRDSWGEIRKEIILGWSYYPFDDRN